MFCCCSFRGSTRTHPSFLPTTLTDWLRTEVHGTRITLLCNYIQSARRTHIICTSLSLPSPPFGILTTAHQRCGVIPNLRSIYRYNSEFQRNVCYSNKKNCTEFCYRHLSHRPNHHHRRHPFGSRTTDNRSSPLWLVACTLWIIQPSDDLNCSTYNQSTGCAPS